MPWRKDPVTRPKVWTMSVNSQASPRDVWLFIRLWVKGNNQILQGLMDACSKLTLIPGPRTSHGLPVGARACQGQVVWGVLA